MNILKKINKCLNGTMKVKGKNNCYDQDFVLKNKVYLKIEGDNNQIIAGKSQSKSRLSIHIYGNNNKIILGEDVHINGMIDIGFKWHNKVDNAVIKIGKGSHLNEVTVVVLEPDSSISIGENCIFASQIDIWASDTHSIIDMSGKLLNYGGKIEIGNHVWVGKGVKIGKFAKISDNSIVGWGSVVASKFDEPNVVIAGNPAKVVKQKVNWSNLSPYNYLNSIENN